MRYLILLLALALPALAQNPNPCTQIRNSATSGQVLSAASSGATPICQWIAGGGGGGGGTVTQINTTAPIQGGPITTTGTITCRTATTAVSGCLSAADWNTFNNKGSGDGTVTSVGLAGTANQITVTGATPITGSGSWTLSIPTNPTLPGTTTGTFSGNLTGNVSGNASTATALASNPTDCGAGEFANAIAANGNLTCATPAGSGNVSAGGTLTSNQIVIGAGTTAVAALGSLGTTTTVLHGNAAGAPTFGAIVNGDITNSTIDLTAKVTGTLPVANGGTGITSFGTGVATALGTNVSGSGAICLASGSACAGTGSGLVLVEQHTASSSASLNFTTCISSTYDEYLVELVQLIPATNAQSVYFRVSTDGGSNYDSGNNYAYAAYRSSAAGAAADGSAAISQVKLDGALLQVNSATTGGFSGFFKFYNPLGGVTNPKLVGEFGGNDGSGNPDVGVRVTGRYVSTTAVNAFQVFFASGNIASGTMRCYGLAK